MSKTSHNSRISIMPDLFEELHIAAVYATNNAAIGIIPCPGRNHIDKSGNLWRRDLTKDLEVIEAWGATAILSLIESCEFDCLGVPNFPNVVSERTISWYHLPIPDMSSPKQAFLNAWEDSGEEILRDLEHGQRIILHCAGGLGRSGMLAAKLLVALGTSPSEAIEQVRHARSGAIETAEQESYIYHGCSLV